MGGSGGSSGSSWSPSETARKTRELEGSTASEGFKTRISEYLRELLSKLNGRDTAAVRKRLDQVSVALEKALDERIDLLFGGSVAKWTHVNGLSDVDCLAIINGTDLEDGGPKAALAHVCKILQARFSREADVDVGRMAVTLKYKDGLELQVLPAIKTANGVKVASSRIEGNWSEIDPKKFEAALTRRNQQCGDQLVPTIKLAKAIMGQLPEGQQLSGYHIESLAIDAFRGYAGTKTPAAMLPEFFERAKERVLRPMTDSTGQTVHVDAYLGPANSAERANAGHLLGRIAKRLSNAVASGQLEQWKALFGEDE
jgi:hypothetical protein